MGQRYVDPLQDRLVSYAVDLEGGSLPTPAVDAARARIVDTFGALVGGFHGEPCRVARHLAAGQCGRVAATVLGTPSRSTAEMAAFANATAARYVETNDVYHWPGSGGGHPSDVIMALVAIAEATGASGAQLIEAVVVAYEAYLRLADAIKLDGFDYTNYALVGSVLGCAKLLRQDADRMAQSLSMAVVANVSLSQARNGPLSMWKAAASGQMAKAAVAACLQAEAGMRGPLLPFDGDHGWLRAVGASAADVAGTGLARMGGEDGTSFKVADTMLKPRPSCATTISSILAAERAAAGLGDRSQIAAVTVEVYGRAKSFAASGDHHWAPSNRESADHSIPYVVAAALLDGTVTPAQFTERRLADVRLRDLLPKIEVIENPEFTAAYEKLPVEHHTRVTVHLDDGGAVTGETRTIKGGPADPMTVDDISEKFLGQVEDLLGSRRAHDALDRLWRLDEVADVAEIPPAFVL